MTWPIIIAIGAATFALRASFLVALDGRAMPRLERYLRYVPVAVLPALAVSAIMGGASGAEHVDLRIGAAVAGAAIAWRTHSVGAAMVAGMVVLWLLQAWSL